MRNEPQNLAEVPRVQLNGAWKIRLQAGRDLVIHGQVENAAGCAYLMFNGKLLGASALRSGGFKFQVQKAVGRLKAGSIFHVVTSAGTVPRNEETTAWQVEAPFVAEGDNVLDLEKQLDKNMRLTKKGTLVAGSMPDEVKRELFDTVRHTEDWFSRECDMPMMVSHGTLLGLYRDGDLIPHDDDFDCLYLSRQPGPEAVAEERFELVRRMRAAGIRAKVGSTGHIKLHADNGLVDLMPAWISDDVLYVSSYSEIPGASAFVEPPSRVEWNSYGWLQTFAQPESFLAAQYGPDWRTPDPGYRAVLTDTGRRNRKALAIRERERKLFR